jgi:hypothetical protein
MTKNNTADDFFDNIDYVSIVNNIKGIYTSDGSMNILLDFERVLDESDVYAFKNWEIGELVQGPDVGRYSVSCIFMWPYKLMPNPKGGLRLTNIGCKIKFKKTKIEVPVEVKDYDDYVPGTRYPKMSEREVWLVYIEIPSQLLDDIKEGSVDLAGKTIDLDELDDSYDKDLDKDGTTQQEENQMQPNGMPPETGPAAPMPAM